MKYLGNSKMVFLFTTSSLRSIQQRESQLLLEYGFNPKKWQLGFDDDIRGVSDEDDLHAVYAVRMESS